MDVVGLEGTDNGADPRHVGVEGEADGRRRSASSDTRTAGAGVHRWMGRRRDLHAARSERGRWIQTRR